mmetsp:Transcript_26093/g.54960  ORF Transcript_26093/g.54960 Transcript_26093/m.54960 type:complete len:91 (-) Transcript_26093:88-360(-)
MTRGLPISLTSFHEIFHCHVPSHLVTHAASNKFLSSVVLSGAPSEIYPSHLCSTVVAYIRTHQQSHTLKASYISRFLVHVNSFESESFCL